MVKNGIENNRKNWKIEQRKSKKKIKKKNLARK